MLQKKFSVYQSAVLLAGSALCLFPGMAPAVEAGKRSFQPDTLAATVAKVETESATEAASSPSQQVRNFLARPQVVAESTATVPRSGSSLERPVADNSSEVVAQGETEELPDIPPGFHRMPDGAIMANNPAKAVAPPGYRLTEAGILVPEDADTSATDHAAHGGMLMAEYRLERMYMDGFLDTTTDVSPQQIIDNYGYSMAPTDMVMDMHMLMIMYHTRSYMIMLMGHYMSNTMGMLSSDGTESTMKNSGIADTLVTLSMPWAFDVSYTLGISIPTGSIDVHGPMQHTASFSSDEKYPYGMQLGSGTWDLLFGLDYESDGESLVFGAGVSYLYRNGTNANDYSLGDRIRMDAWLKHMFTDTLSLRAGLDYLEVGRIEGADADMNAAMSPTADADNYGGRRLDLGLQLKYETAMMTSIALDYTMPVHQNLWGPQMKTQWMAGISLGYMF